MLGRWSNTDNSFAGSGNSFGSAPAPSHRDGNWAESFRLDHAALIGQDRPGPRRPVGLYWLLATTSVLSVIVFGLAVQTTGSVSAGGVWRAQDGQRADLQAAEDKMTALVLELRSEKDAAEMSRALLNRRIDDSRLALESVEAEMTRTREEARLASARADDREEALHRLQTQFDSGRAEIATLRSEATDLLTRLDFALRARSDADAARQVAEKALADARLAGEDTVPAQTELASIDAETAADLMRDGAEADRVAAGPVTDRAPDASPTETVPVGDLRPRWLTLGGATFASLDATAYPGGVAASRAATKVAQPIIRRISLRPAQGRSRVAIPAPSSPSDPSSPDRRRASADVEADSSRSPEPEARTNAAPKPTRSGGPVPGKKLGNPK